MDGKNCVLNTQERLEFTVERVAVCMCMGSMTASALSATNAAPS